MQGDDRITARHCRKGLLVVSACSIFCTIPWKYFTARCYCIHLISLQNTHFSRIWIRASEIICNRQFYLINITAFYSIRKSWRCSRTRRCFRPYIRVRCSASTYSWCKHKIRIRTSRRWHFDFNIRSCTFKYGCIVFVFSDSEWYCSICAFSHAIRPFNKSCTLFSRCSQCDIRIIIKCSISRTRSQFNIVRCCCNLICFRLKIGNISNIRCHTYCPWSFCIIITPMVKLISISRGCYNRDFGTIINFHIVIRRRNRTFVCITRRNRYMIFTYLELGSQTSIFRYCERVWIFIRSGCIRRTIHPTIEPVAFSIYHCLNCSGSVIIIRSSSCQGKIFIILSSLIILSRQSNIISFWFENSCQLNCLPIYDVQATSNIRLGCIIRPISELTMFRRIRMHSHLCLITPRHIIGGSS